MLESELAVALNWCSLVKQGEWTDEVLGLCQKSDMGEYWSVVATPIVFMASVFLDHHRAIRVILYQDSVSVGHALIVLIYIIVLILFSFVCWHKCDLLLLITRENV